MTDFVLVRWRRGKSSRWAAVPTSDRARTALVGFIGHPVTISAELNARQAAGLLEAGATEKWDIILVNERGEVIQTVR